MLHYRRTGFFAQELLRTAPDAVTRAYATGYMTHVAGDICGHPFVNGIVGGPYRNHALRHLVVENIIDSWIWNHYTKGGDLTKAKLHEKIDVGGDLSPIVNHLLRTMQTVYVKQGIAPGAFNNSLPSEDDMVKAYKLMYTFLEISTDIELKRPTPPPTSPGAIIQEVLNHVGNSVQHIGEQFDGDNEWWEWLLAPFLAAMWALVALVQIATIPAAVITRMAVSDLRWAIYLIEVAIYELICNMRWQLVLGGWGKPSTDDLGRTYAQLCLRVPTQRTGLAGFRCYPQQAVDRNIQGFWLADPGFSRQTVECKAPTECCPYSQLPPFADTFMTVAPYDVANDMHLKNFTKDENTVSSTINIEQETCQSTQLGNASDFAIMLLNGEYPVGSFDLDADMGYGFQSWDPDHKVDDDSVKWSPEYRPEFSKPQP